MHNRHPEDEEGRQRALLSYEILDTEPEKAYDDITRLAASICEAPHASISFLEADRQWFKSVHGAPIENTRATTIFCKRVIESRAPFVVTDTTSEAQNADERSLFRFPGFRFYAGVPLLDSEGYALGTLAVVDYKVRELSADQLEALTTLADGVIARLELHRSLIVVDMSVARQHEAHRRLDDAQSRLQRVAERHDAILVNIGVAISTAQTLREAALIVVRTAQHLFGWDACSLDLIDSATGYVQPILTMDTLNDVPVDVPPAYSTRAPSPIVLKTLREGPQLILRDAESDGATSNPGELEPFGDIQRRSESLMLVPVWYSNRSIGVLSIQSYTPNAYDVEALKGLLSLATHAAGGIERIRIAATLNDTEARRQWSLEAANMGDWEWDIETGRVRLSTIAEDLHGLEPGTFAGTAAAFKNLVYRDDVNMVDEIIGQAVKNATVMRAEYRVVLRDGTTRWLAASGRTRFDILNASRTMLGVVWDITERVLLQEQLLQARKMDSVGRLAGGIAHDFNNLLTAILGFSALAIDEIPTDHAAQPLLNRVRQAGERAAELTKQLLAFARREMIAPRILNLADLVHESVVLMGPLLGENIDVREIRDSDPCLVRADEGQLQQVVMNLAVNARDAMPNGGTISLEVKQTHISEPSNDGTPQMTPGDYALLTVSDSGAGIAEDVMKRLFEPFFTTKDVGKGTGLGLSTCYGIVSQNGGFIWVESQPGCGAKFTVCLPIVEAGGILTQDSATAKPTNGTETVMVVEDESLVRQMAVRTLRSIGYTVIEAENGAEALNIARGVTRIDLLITDIMMPGIGGPELAAALTISRPTLRTLFISGYGYDESSPRHAAYQLLQKPFSPMDLANTVRMVLDSDEPTDAF